MEQSENSIKTRRRQEESLHQQALVGWARSNGAPLLYAIPNGGNRDAREGERLKLEGVMPGIPDLHLPMARGGFHSLYIEMKKAKGGTTSPEQLAVHALLRAEGHRVEVCAGYEAARSVLAQYLAAGCSPAECKNHLRPSDT